MPFGLQDRGALLALGLHLAGHDAGEVGRRHDVLDLDAVDLHAPGRGRRVHHPQQPLVDLVAMRQQLVEVHRADHGADVGHGQVEQRAVEVRDLVGGARRVEHLVEDHRVDGDAGIVPGERLLARHVDHLLHHVDLAADALEIRHDQAEPGLERAGVAAEALDRVDVALRHRPDARKQGEHREHHDDDDENSETADRHRSLPD